MITGFPYIYKGELSDFGKQNYIMMINKVWRKKLIAAAISSAICLGISICILVAAAVTGFCLVYSAVAAAVLCAAAVIILWVMFNYIKRESLSFRSLESSIPDYAYIRFDREKEIAYLSSNVELITGITAGSCILEDLEYSKFISKMIECPYNLDEKIYMSCVPEKWMQLDSYSDKNYEYTIIRDVSKYVCCKNVIKSLRFYDMATGILSRDAFVTQIRTASDANKATIGLIHFVVSGIEKISSFSGTNAADNIISKIAVFIKKYENPHNIFTGRMSSCEFSMLVTDTYDEGCHKLADKVHSGLLDMLSQLSYDEKNNVRIYCGYAYFHGNENSIGTMMSSVDFAAFDAESQGSTKPVLFNPVTYARRAHEFKKIQVFNTVIANNMIDYHFQPIVNARTGLIYGYEALMRPQEIDGIKLSPLEMLSIAEQQEMLHEIERITFFNALKLLSENQDFFCNRKLFINCIQNSMLSDTDYEKLSESYGELFEKIVVEITEGCPVLDSAVTSLNTRFRSHKAQVALDDYGTGYSNDSTLLSVKPDYVKIDRSIMMDIDKDIQKQHLVANMVNFASQHGITTLGEGIETLEELETAISLGVDLIQGFITCRATAILMLDIPLDIKNDIITYNLKQTGRVDKVFEITDSNPVDIVNLALIGYTEIIIKNPKAVIKGDANVEVNMKISTEVTGQSVICITNVNIISPDGPAITLCKGSDVNLELNGKNTLSHDGIRVPAGAALYICGKGNLNIFCTKNNSAGIGGSYIQDFGQITIDCDGIISISNKGDNLVGIGGGLGSFESLVKLISGRVSLVLKGKDIVGIGSFSNITSISINPVKIDITMGGQNVVGIGSKNGQVTIDSAANITANISGDNCCCIGTLEKGSGNIKINGGSTDIVVKGKNVVGVGAINGNIEVVLNAGHMGILCEADNATCIGDNFGSGYVRIWGADIKATAKASLENPVGVKNGKVYIMGGSVVTSDIAPLKCFGPDETPLKMVAVDGHKKFKENVCGKNAEYIYVAEANNDENMYLYLPEAYICNSQTV